MASLRPLRTTSVLRTLPHSIKPSPYLCRPLTTTPNLHHNTTVDPSEVTHFNALASTCYLDVGCGGGIFAESAARLKNTASVTAIDPSPEVLSVAVAHAKRDPGLVSMMGEGRLEYLNTSIEELPRPGTEGGRQYDVVTLFEVLEHVTHPAPFLEHLLPFVKPGGWLVLSTIARTWTSWLTTKVVAEEVVGIVPRGTHDWNKYINEGELREWFAKKEGWGNMRAMGVVYVPGLGWREVPGSEGLGNYFFGVRKEGMEDERESWGKGGYTLESRWNFSNRV
ncbi:Hexaprenyldihydroxybenzoate methyltransferase, mitochondrial [Coniosporium tulheliwenetii]|uniref:Hexaprenyldihydroxybenzoate methyltransferase, mitochondrial n=1 Tax=Coniosporium tulheliwenetii TaxID=3383036 RepID=A0ACC2YJ29_9PEZI|nr:Hexaprenyldihydroxybenzoate methyltransferase, mitochondrial [Cladosporium sp. JES 115]